MNGHQILSVLVSIVLLTLTSCGFPPIPPLEGRSAVAEEGTPKGSTKQSLVPDPAYYSTPKGRNLASRYETNLENILAQIVASPATETLQFADPNLSIKSIGFFSHASAKSPDERYLEVIVWVPNVFDEKTNFSSKFQLLFSRYASALLGILSSDTAISNDGLVAGYGLNFSWRTTSGSKVNLERGVIYLAKDKAQKFLSGQISQEEVLSGAAIYAFQGGESARQVRYTQPAPALKLDLEPREVEGSKLGRSDIREADLPSPSSPLPQERKPEAVTIPLETVNIETVKKVETIRIKTVKEKGPPIKEVKVKRPLETKILRGYMVQLLLTKLAEAEHWSLMFERDGYSTSIELVGENAPVHLRVGSFSSYARANTFLIGVGRKNLKGYVVFAP